MVGFGANGDTKKLVFAAFALCRRIKISGHNISTGSRESLGVGTAVALDLVLVILLINDLHFNYVLYLSYFSTTANNIWIYE